MDISNMWFGTFLRDAFTGRVVNVNDRIHAYFGQPDDSCTLNAVVDIDTLQTVFDYATVAKFSDVPNGIAAAHLVLKVSDELYVMFYTQFDEGTKREVRAAVCTEVSPSGPFLWDSGFSLTPAANWEHNLESTSAWVLAEYNDEDIIGYIGYESANEQYLFGWAKVRISRKTGKVTLISRSDDNPLWWMVPDGYPLFVIGFGNAEVTGLTETNQAFTKHVGYYGAISPSGSIEIWKAISDDGLFSYGTREFVAVVPDGTRNRLAEKFCPITMFGKNSGWYVDRVFCEFGNRETKAISMDVIAKYGTSEGVRRAWDTRGRGTHEREGTPGVHEKPENPEIDKPIDYDASAKPGWEKAIKSFKYIQTSRKSSLVKKETVANFVTELDNEIQAAGLPPVNYLLLTYKPKSKEVGAFGASRKDDKSPDVPYFEYNGSWLDNPDNINAHQALIAKKTKFFAKPWTMGDKSTRNGILTSNIQHEVGHYLLYAYSRIMLPPSAGLTSLSPDWHKTVVDALRSGWLPPSRYVDKQLGDPFTFDMEMFAECYVGYRQGVGNIHPEIVKFIEHAKETVGRSKK